MRLLVESCAASASRSASMSRSNAAYDLLALTGKSASLMTETTATLRKSGLGPGVALDTKDTDTAATSKK